MDTADIQKRLDALVLAMLAKGLREPRATARLKSNEQPMAGIEWKDPSTDFGTAYEYPSADTIPEAMDKAAAIIAAMPEAQQRKLNDFMAAVGKVIDLGRETGIEAEFVNPLVTTMKKLSENALTFQKQAAE